MQFKRFYKLYYDESRTEFDTYLPVQLYATCKGSQGMALLSNDKTFFKQLNLTVDNIDENTEAIDFYNFLLELMNYLIQRVVV